MVSPKELDTWLKGALAASGPPALEQSLQAAIATWGKSVFEQFDTDKNGFLDNKELGRALKALPKTKPTSAPPNAKYMSVEEMIAAMDADGSGGVDMQEWLSNLAKCAGLAAALAESVNDSGVIEKFRSFEQQKVRRCASVRGRAGCDKTVAFSLLGRRFFAFLRAISRCVFPGPCPSPSLFLFLRQAKREKEIAELEGKLVTASPEEMEKISAEMAEYERQVASLSKKIEEAAANAAARAGA